MAKSSDQESQEPIYQKSEDIKSGQFLTKQFLSGCDPGDEDDSKEYRLLTSKGQRDGLHRIGP